MKYRFFKRAFDLTLALTLLPLMFLVSIPIAVCIKLDSKGPIIIRQKRVGKDLKEFVCYKFRTMRVGTPTVARSELTNREVYITNVGKVLRRHGFDEILQIINVLKGEMSFVGARPLLACEEDVHRMRQECGIYTLPPGITGLCQISCRDPKNAYERVALDYEYFCKKSMRYDISLLFQTVFVEKLTLDRLLKDVR